MVPILVQQRLSVHAVVTVAGLSSAGVILGRHGGVASRYESGLAIQSKVSRRYGIAALVVLQFPGMVTIAMQDRLVLDAMISHSGYLTLAVKGRAKDGYAASE